MTQKTGFLFIVLLMVGIGVFAGDTKSEISGQIRYRHEASDRDFIDTTGFSSMSALRSRIQYKFDTMNGVSGLIQIQDSRNYGEETSTLTDGAADNLDFHQAYVLISPFFYDSINLKIGRFEAAYGPQRLIGSVGWHNIGRSFDGLVFNYVNDRMSADIFNMKDGTIDVSGVYASFKVREGYKSQLFHIRDDNRSTSGLYSAGSFGNIGYEVEAATQTGEQSSGVNYAGWLLGLNASMKMGGFKLAAGVDLISGDDPATTDKNEMFSTLYATNHKYYGSMDYFLNLPAHTEGLGLIDMHFKVATPGIMGFSPKVAYHIFSSHVESPSGDTDFGSELDLSVAHKLNASSKLVTGYSLFMPGSLKSSDDTMGQWYYLMTIVNF